MAGRLHPTMVKFKVKKKNFKTRSVWVYMIILLTKIGPFIPAHDLKFFPNQCSSEIHGSLWGQS